MSGRRLSYWERKELVRKLWAQCFVTLYWAALAVFAAVVSYKYRELHVIFPVGLALLAGGSAYRTGKIRSKLTK